MKVKLGTYLALRQKAVGFFIIGIYRKYETETTLINNVTDFERFVSKFFLNKSQMKDSRTLFTDISYIISVIR